MLPLPATIVTSSTGTVKARTGAERGGTGNLTGVLEPGAAAPDFTLPDQDGHPVTLSELRGSWVLLWWYPKAATPG